MVQRYKTLSRRTIRLSPNTYVETANVVSLGNLALMENHIDGTGMIYYIQPVAHVLTLTIYWQWLAMTDVVDDQMFLTLYFHHSIALSTVGAMS